MAWTGKIIGGGLGWAIFGPLGALLGGVLGNQFDKRSEGVREIPFDYYERSDYSRDEARYQGNPAGSFMAALMALCAHVIRADGEVHGSEVRAVREFVTQSFPHDAQDLMQVLKELLDHPAVDVTPICAQIMAHMGYYERLELVQLLVGVALADGALHPSEARAIQELSARLGITPADLRTLLGAAGAYSRADGSYRKAESREDPYQVLGMSSSAGNDELRKAYRELAKKFHPDRVQHLGEDVRKFSEEKFKKLQQAWDEIRKERGL